MRIRGEDNVLSCVSQHGRFMSPASYQLWITNTVDEILSRGDNLFQGVLDNQLSRIVFAINLPIVVPYFSKVVNGATRRTN